MPDTGETFDPGDVAVVDGVEFGSRGAEYVPSTVYVFRDGGWHYDAEQTALLRATDNAARLN